MSIYFYTRMEGGFWISAPIHSSEQEVETALDINWDSNSKLSILDGITVHSVRFPSGRIWDSYIKGFDPDTLNANEGV